MLFRFCLLASLVLAIAVPATAAAVSTVRLDELTTTELRDAIGAGMTTILRLASLA